MNLGAIAAGAPFLDAIFNFGSTMWGNQRVEDLAREAVGQLSQWNDQSSQRFDLKNFLGRSGVAPDLTWDAMEGIFSRSGPGVQDTFNESYGHGQDWAKVLTDANKALDVDFRKGANWSGARSDVMSALSDRDWFNGRNLGGEVGGYFGDESFDSWLAAQKGNIGLQSESRQEAGNAQLLASELARGKSMEEAGAVLAAANRSEAQARGQAGLNAEASREGMSAQYRAQKAAAQAQAAVQQAMTEAGISSDLAKARASSILGLTQGESAETNAMNQILATLAGEESKNIIGVGERESAERLTASGQRASLRGWDINDELQRARDTYSSWDKQKQDALSTAKWAQQSQWNSEDSFRAIMAQILAGIPVTIPQSNAAQQGASNYISYMQANKEPKGGSGFGFLTFNVSTSCISGDSMVITDCGPVRLRDVMPRAWVKGADGEFHVVVAKDYGYVPESKRKPHFRITAADGLGNVHDIVATEHTIEGKKCGDWKENDFITVHGDTLRVIEVKEVPYVLSGDLMLEGNVPYLANGFIVESEIGKMGLEKWRKHLKSQGGRVAAGFVHGVENEECFARTEA